MSKVYQMVKERSPDGKARWIRSRKTVAGGRWFIDYTDHAGKQIRSRTAAMTKKEALRILRARMGERARAEAAGMNPQAFSMTLERFLDEEFLPHVRLTRRPSTAKTYEAHAVNLKGLLGSMLLSELTRGDVLKVQTHLLQRNEKNSRQQLAPATINRFIAFIRTALFEAVSREYIDRNPASRIKLLPEENIRYRVISTLEEGKLLGASPPWLASILRIALLTGLRQGEILRLRHHDIDRERRLIHVSSEAKNHDARLVPYPRALEPVLAELLPEVDGQEPATTLLFSTPEGKVFKPQRVVNAFRRAAGIAGLYDCTFHDTRRTYASRLVDLGVSLPVVSKLLGHGTTYVTERYAHVSDGATGAAVVLLDEREVSRLSADEGARDARAQHPAVTSHT